MNKILTIIIISLMLASCSWIDQQTLKGESDNTVNDLLHPKKK